MQISKTHLDLEQVAALGALLVEGDKLCGERVYASAATIRRMIGPLYDELIDL